MIDHTREIPAAETVVDVHDGNAAGAGVEHAEKRRDTAEARAVAHAGGDGDHGAVGEATDDARDRKSVV